MRNACKRCPVDSWIRGAAQGNDGITNGRARGANYWHGNENEERLWLASLALPGIVPFSFPFPLPFPMSFSFSFSISFSIVHLECETRRMKQSSSRRELAEHSAKCILFQQVCHTTCED